jgi:hypothetical protein
MDGSSSLRLAQYAAAGAAIERHVRTQQDFPQPGVLFRDLTPVLANARALRDVAVALAAAAPDATLIAGLESRGFLLGAATAAVAGLGVLAVRKPGKLPGHILFEDYALEYGRTAPRRCSGRLPGAGDRRRAGDRRDGRRCLPVAAAGRRRHCRSCGRHRTCRATRQTRIT